MPVRTQCTIPGASIAMPRWYVTEGPLMLTVERLYLLSLCCMYFKYPTVITSGISVTYEHGIALYALGIVHQGEKHQVRACGPHAGSKDDVSHVRTSGRQGTECSELEEWERRKALWPMGSACLTTCGVVGFRRSPFPLENLKMHRCQSNTRLPWSDCCLRKSACVKLCLLIIALVGTR